MGNQLDMCGELSPTVNCEGFIGDQEFKMYISFAARRLHGDGGQLFDRNLYVFDLVDGQHTAG
jgi:hypothetical protein